MTTEWNLEPSDTILRRQLHEDYGGRTQGGISPSRQTPNVMIFTDASGEQHGYFDIWDDTGTLHYTGEGQFGDQRMAQGNLAILNAENDRRAIRLFRGARGTVEYLGEVALDWTGPWYTTDARESGAGPDDPTRSVIKFRLVPKDFTPPKPRSPLEATALRVPATTTDVIARPIEDQHTERMQIDPDREPYEAERREARLVREYAEHLRRLGHTVYRHEIRPQGETLSLFTDLFDETAGVLVEAKGSTSRASIRMAIGQLTDYGRFVDHKSNAVLLPSSPRDDVAQLIAAAGMHFVYPNGDGTYSGNA